MPATYIFTTSAYTKDEVFIGNILPNIQSPTDDAYIPDLTKDDFPEPAEDSDISAHVDEESLGSFHGTFTAAVWKAICSIFWRSEQSSNFTITADKGRTYTLRDPRSFLARLLSDEHLGSGALREKLKDWHDDSPVRPVLVVGCRTLDDAKLVRHDKVTSSMSASAQGIAGGRGDADNGLANAHIQAGRGHKAGETFTVRSDGERVFAIRYRAINITVTESEVTASLERSGPNSWRIFPQTRGKPIERVEIVEAVLDDSDYVAEGEVIPAGDNSFVQLSADED